MNIKIFYKENCSYCVRAKMLLKSKGLQYEQYLVDTTSQLDIDRVKKELGIDNFKTVPQISIDGKHIGGYNELKEFFEKN